MNENEEMAESENAELKPIPEYIRERVLKEELARLDSAEAELLKRKKKRVDELRTNPVLWHGVERAEGRISASGKSVAASVLGVERTSILRELRSAYYGHLLHLTNPRSEGGLELSMEEALHETRSRLETDGDKKAVLAIYEHLLHQDVTEIGWQGLDELFRGEQLFAEDIWLCIKEEARKQFESGHFIAKVFEHTRELNTPFKRGEFLAVRESMREQWKPNGGIDDAMVDMLAVTFFLWSYWQRQAILRSETEVRRESYDYQQWRQGREKHEYKNGVTYKRPWSGQWLNGAWDLPYQCEADAIGQAVEMADRYRRAFQAQIRQMRDWRRYSSPVIVQNAEQVNVASDGGQQVNVQSKGRGSKKGTGKKRAGRKALTDTSGERVNLGKARKVKVRA